MNKEHPSSTGQATKLCPHCQKEIPKGATKCPECQSDLRPWYRRHPILSAIGIIILVGIVLSSLGDAREAASTAAGTTASDTPASSGGHVSIGENGYLRITGDDKVTVFTSQKALDEYTSAAVSKDTYGMAQIIYDGRGYFVPAGTKVLLIGYGGIGEGNVRVLEGDHTGESVWVPTDFISAN